MADLVLHITTEQRQRIEAMAHQRGYDAIDSYLVALAELDAQGSLVLRDSNDYLTQEQLEANFKQGLHEVMTGKTYPIDKLWDMVDDD